MVFQLTLIYPSATRGKDDVSYYILQEINGCRCNPKTVSATVVARVALLGMRVAGGCNRMID